MFRTSIIAAALAACLASPVMADGIEVHDAYAIASRPGAPTGAAFMVIDNLGGPDDRLIGARSAIAARTELHTHVEADGMMQMRQVTEGLPIPTDGQIVMARGGYHVMFLGLTEPMVDGQTVAVTLVFEIAGEVTVAVPVAHDRPGAMAPPEASGSDGPADHSHGG